MATKSQMTSGINFIQIEEFIRYKWGTDGLVLYNKHNNLKYGKIFEEKLYPFNDYIELLIKIQEVFNDEKLAFNLGWHRGRHLLLAKGEDKNRFQLLDKVASAWDKFNNFGKVSTQKHSENKISIQISDYTSHPIYCDRTRGFFAGLISGDMKETCKVKEIKCVCNGGDCCEFVIEI